MESWQRNCDQEGQGSDLAPTHRERTMTFTVEDALISPVSLAMLTGAGLNNVTDASNATGTYIYQPVQFDLPIVKGRKEGTACVHLDYDTAQDAHDIYFSENKGQIFGTVLDNAGAGVYFLSLATDGIKLIENGEIRKDDTSTTENPKDYIGECVPGDTDGGHVFTIPSSANSYLELTFVDAEQYIGCTLRVDCYCQRSSGARQITIDAENFAGDFYIEASTLFRDQYTKKDMPAVFVIPDAKIQSNFTFTMANSGDPSSFTFTMDAFPDYTKFDRTKKVFCAIQIMGDENVLPKDSLVKDDTCDPADPAITSAVPGKEAKYGRNLKTEITRKNIDFFGMLYPVSDTTDYLAKWNKLTGKTETVLPEGEATGYYFPVTLTGGTKYAYKSVAGTALTSNDGDMLFAVDSTNPVVEVKVTGASDDKVSTYAFDFSKCVFK